MSLAVALCSGLLPVLAASFEFLRFVFGLPPAHLDAVPPLLTVPLFYAWPAASVVAVLACLSAFLDERTVPAGVMFVLALGNGVLLLAAYAAVLLKATGGC